ncbi:MAG: hypothetical protein ABFE01_02460 [Phycisphaerales bacterium]|jgi:hypothetical protein
MNMKRPAFFLGAILLAGCAPIVSLHPLFTKENIVFEEKLVGTWVKDVNNPEVIWKFSRLDESAAKGLLEPWKDVITKFYGLDITDQDGRKGSFAACLVKLGDRMFLDVFADRFPSGEQDVEKAPLAYNAFFFVPVHTFIRVDSIGDQLAIHVTDDDRFKELIQAVPTPVKHEIVDDRPVLTASTNELQEFVTKFATDERLFPNDLTLVRKTK